MYEIAVPPEAGLPQQLADDTSLPFDLPWLLSASVPDFRIECWSQMNLASFVRRATVAVKEGRAGGALKRRIKPALGQFARAAARQPLLRRCAGLILNSAPGLKTRLRRLADSPAAITKASEISPAAQRIYSRLKVHQNIRKAD